MVSLNKLKSNRLQILVHAGALWLLASLAWDYTQNTFLVDPVREMTTRTGRLALAFLLLSLACTPINTLLGYKKVLRLRRPLGLYAFVFAALHFLIFVGLDYGFDLALLRPAILDQRFVLAGTAALAILLPLALTSTKGWQRRLRKNWRRLHKLVYLSAILVILHFMWLSKDPREPRRYGIILALLLVTRIPFVKNALLNLRRRYKIRRQASPINTPIQSH
jgi:sulfoxide reductase heme-binding subunit YedZ